MNPVPPDVARIGTALFRRIYKKCQQIAHAEIVGYFGQAWRGGKFQWPFLLPGHGFELTQTGLHTFTTSDLTITTDVSAIQTLTYPIAYASTSTPRVMASSADTDWEARARPNATNPHTQIDVWLKRADSRTLTQFGTTTGTIIAGTDHVDVSVTFPAAFVTSGLSVPVVSVNTNTPLTRAVLGVVTVHDFTVDVYYVPPTATGQIGYSVTGLGDPTGTAEKTFPGGGETVTSTATGGAGSPNATGNNSDGTVTGGVQGSPSTGNQSTDHTHLEHDAGGQTGIQQSSAAHNHGLALPGSDHTHLHNDPMYGGTHTHQMPSHDHDVTTTDHTHTLVEPPAGGGHAAGHTHTFVGDTEDAPSATTFTLHWVALGGRVVAAATVDLTWAASGIQAS